MGLGAVGYCEMLEVVAFWGGGESFDSMEISVTMGIEVLLENEKYGAKVALSRRPSSTLKVLSRTTPPSHLHSQRNI